MIWLTVVALLVARSHVRAYYLAAAYPVLFAAGAVALEQRLGPRWTIGWTGVTALVSAVLAPLSLPLMSIPSFFVYEARLGLAAPTEQAEARATKLPLHFATKLANPPVAAAVAEAWATLTPAEQADAVILTQSYTEAGAVDRLGPALGLPPSISFHVNHWIWGPGEARSIAIVTADADDSILERFRHVERAATIDCPLCMGSVHDAVYVCRDPLRPIPEIWPELKRYR